MAALNRSAFVLLCSHLQGFIDDLHREAATLTLAGRAQSANDIVALVRPRNANPHAEVIDRMFAGIGIYDLMNQPHWRRCANGSVRRRLTTYIEDRNRIAHGNRLTISKNKVSQFRDFVTLLSDALDQAVGAKVALVTGVQPW